VPGQVVPGQMLGHDPPMILRRPRGAKKVETDFFQLLTFERRHQKSSFYDFVGSM